MSPDLYPEALYLEGGTGSAEGGVAEHKDMWLLGSVRAAPGLGRCPSQTHSRSWSEASPGKAEIHATRPSATCSPHVGCVPTQMRVTPQRAPSYPALESNKYSPGLKRAALGWREKGSGSGPDLQAHNPNSIPGTTQSFSNFTRSER